MKRHELIVIGAGPAGLSAAIEAKKNGMDVIVFDENQMLMENIYMIQSIYTKNMSFTDE